MATVSVRRVVGLLPGPPVALAVAEAVEADCGCVVYIGLRLDNGEPATGACSCGPGHRYEMANFNESLRISLVADPQARPMAEVCAELLEDALR